MLDLPSPGPSAEKEKMEHILNLDDKGLKILHEEIFPKIADRETILFLGAGISATDEKKFLSADKRRHNKAL